MAYQTIKGMYDVYGEEYRYFEKIDTLFKHFAELYGYEMIKTPILEYTGVFKKDNDTSDMVTKEMYTFTLNNKDYLTLRPEGTAGVIRSFVQNKMYGNELPVKLAYIGEMFRHERPQKGRQRQFNQLGIENIGNKDPLIDAEVIAFGYFFLKTLGIKDIKVLLNSLGDYDSRLNYKKALSDYFKDYEAELCGDCKDRLFKNPLRILDCKIDREKEFVRNAPKMSDYLSEDSLHYFDKVQMYLKALDIPFMIDDRLVRGLDYYTDTVFEVVSTNEESGAQSTIFGGGRYDNLVKEMGGPELSGIGFAIGEERLLILAKAEGIFTKEEKSLDAYVVNLLKDDPYALEVLSILRANSYSGEMDYYNRSLKAQFKSADRRKVRFTIIVGEDEKKTQSVNVKDAKTKMQDNVRLDDLIDYLDEKMGEEYE